MSLDRTLKTKGSLTRHRNVLTRAERILQMADENQWNEGDPVFGLPKMSHRKIKVGGKEKKAAAKTAEEAGETGETTTTTTTEPK